jgi:hypothetical protein
MITEHGKGCRLCEGGIRKRFELELIGKHKVSYHECEDCGCLQTETPHWLPEVYSSHLTALDTGIAQRNITNLAAIYAISRLLDLHNIIDFGGGDGLLCRLLRDYGLNCYVSDKFAAPTYARGFTRPDFSAPDLVAAFEVLEHFAEPRAEIAEVFALAPKVVLLTTAEYRGQGADWWYLSPETGQHVFFYNAKGMGYLAGRYGYDVSKRGAFWIFCKKGMFSARKRWLANFLLKGSKLKWVKGMLCFTSARGVARDFEALRAAARRQGEGLVV